MDAAQLAERYGKEAVGNIKKSLAERWDLLTLDEKASIQRACHRFIELNLRGTTGVDTAEDLEFVRVTVEQFEFAARISAEDTFTDTFWEGVSKAMTALGTFLVNMGKAIILGAINAK